MATQIYSPAEEGWVNQQGDIIDSDYTLLTNTFTVSAKTGIDCGFMIAYDPSDGPRSLPKLLVNGDEVQEPWVVQRLGTYGIKDFPFLEGTVSVYRRADDKTLIIFENEYRILKQIVSDSLDEALDYVDPRLAACFKRFL